MSAQLLSRSGYLLTSIDGTPLNRALMQECASLRYVSRYGDTKWYEYELESDLPLLNEFEEYNVAPPYRYPIYCRISGQRILLLSKRKVIVSELLLNAALGRLGSKLLRLNFTIDRLIEHLVSDPCEYTLSFVHTRVSIYGKRLKAISFYGEDVSRADLFRDHRKRLDCFVCGLRQTSQNSEVIRVGNDGSVFFQMSKNDIGKQLAAVEQALHFLRENGFISESSGLAGGIPPEDDEKREI